MTPQEAPPTKADHPALKIWLADLGFSKKTLESL